MQDHASPPQLHSNGYRAWVLGILVSAYTCGFIDRTVISVLGQPLKLELGLTDLQLGLLGGMTFAVVNAVLSIPVARLAERFKRVTIIALGVGFWSLATMACGVAGNYAQLLMARLGVGVGEAVIPAASSLVSDHFPRDRRATAFSIYLLAVPLGAFIGAAGGGWVASHYGWREAFFIAGAPGLLIAGLLSLTVREPKRGGYDVVAGQSPGNDETPPLSAVLRTLVAKRALLHFIAGGALASMAGYGLTFFVAPYLSRAFGMDFAQAGLYAGLISSFPAAASMLVGGMLSDRLARRDERAYAWIPAATVTLSVPLVVLALLQSQWMLAVGGLMLAAVAQFAYIPAGTAVMQNALAPRMRASGAAIMSLITTLVGFGLGPTVLGLLSDVLAQGAFDKLAPGAVMACDGQLAPALVEACATASVDGLRHAMCLVTVLYLWAGAHYLLAARTLRHDLHSASAR